MNYSRRQAQWIKDNDIEVGSRVRVMRKAETYQDGWNTSWEEKMDALVGQEGEVSVVDAHTLGILVRFENGDSWYFPFFVLEPAIRDGLKAFAQAVKVLVRGGRLKTSCGTIGMEDDGTLYVVGSKDTPDGGSEEVHLRCDVEVKQLVDLANEMGHDELWLQNCGAALTAAKHEEETLDG
jgi:hypothetical protein